jgi:hypothetical protein
VILLDTTEGRRIRDGKSLTVCSSRWGSRERDVRVITYGKCQKSPYVENGLWFVYVPRITETSMTFFVTEEYARPSVMDNFDTDLAKWKSIAHKSIPGSDWNPEYECIWGEMPFYVHILPDGTPIRYGLSRTQSVKHPDRELWYIVIGLGDDPKVEWSRASYEYEMFVVDKICTTPEIMNRLGKNPKRWMRICWSHPVGLRPWDLVHLDEVPSLNAISRQSTETEKLNRSWWEKIFRTD